MAVLEATRLTGCSSMPSFISSGSKMIFNMPTSPTSWSKDTTPNSAMLRITNGTTSPGGSLTFPQTFATRPYSLSSSDLSTFTFSVASTTVEYVTMPSTNSPGTVFTPPATISTAQMRPHSHVFQRGAGAGTPLAATRVNTGTSDNLTSTPTTTIQTQATGQGGAHNHSFDDRHVHPFPTIGSHFHPSVPSSSPHNHPLSPGSISGFSLTYVDFIISSKD